MSRDLLLSIRATTGREQVTYLRRHIRRAHGLVRAPLRELSIALVGDSTMARLHRRHLNLPGPTDVLTFELDHDLRGRPTSGEIIICVPQAKRQAALHRIPWQRELMLYALHGMLHLCGHDDRTERAYRRMHRTEDRILTDLGIGATFAIPMTRRPSASRRRRATSPSRPEQNPGDAGRNGC